MKYPKSLSLRKFIHKLQSQEDIPCCTACATLLPIEMMFFKAGKTVLFSRLFLYYMARQIQGRERQIGTTIQATLAALETHGICQETTWPFIKTIENRTPGIRELKEASEYKLTSFRQIEPKLYKYYLNKGMPIVASILTGKKFWELKGKYPEHNYYPVDDKDNKPTIGHAICIIGYDDNLNGGSWLISNSKGYQWGDDGYAAIPYSCNVDIGESFVIKEFAGITADKKITSD